MHRVLAILPAVALLIPTSAAAEKRVSPPAARVGGLSMTYPDRFHRRDFTSCDYRVTGVHGACVSGVVVANIRLSSSPELGASHARLGRTVAKFELVTAAPQPDVRPPTATFPLALKNLRDGSRGMPPQRPRFSQLELFFRVKDSNYWAIAWVGKKISRADYKALSSIVASIRTT